MINVKVDNKEEAMQSEAALSCVAEAEKTMGNTGRVLLRPSGTEPVVRVMVEAESEDVAQSWAQKIADKL